LFYFREESTPTTGRKEERFENDKVFVEGISTKTSKDSLKYYMERISGLPVKDITYGSDSVNAVGKFHGTVGESRNDPENISEDVVMWNATVVTELPEQTVCVELIATQFKKVSLGD
jgi:hypothetical protein